jgi:tetratricopeptide (TPR) repeat protein
MGSLLAAVGVALAGGVAIAQSSVADAHTAQSTQEMAQRLAAIFRANDWKGDPNKPAERAVYYDKMLQERKLPPSDQMQVLLQMATELLNAGESEKAINAIDRLRKIAQENKIVPPEQFDTKVRGLAAISYLRLGEQENCQHMHGQKSCLFPIKGSGVHSLPRGAEGAVRELTAMLERNPKDWESQWLLNVAYMQLGRYPKDVPKRWLVDEALFRSERDLGEFDDVAMQAGLAVMGHSGGVAMQDFDGDGLLDLAVTSSGPMDQMHLFHNNGDGTFADWTARAGLTGEMGGLNMVATDYDNDGHIDLLVLRGGWWGRFGEYPMSLLRNRGDGTFEDVTVKAGLLSLHPTQTAAWADYDGDGWLDLFVGHEWGARPGDVGGKEDEHPSQLFHNNHDGTFTEVGSAMGLAKLGFVKGVAWGDFNNDGRPDLYVSIKGGRNHLFRNDGPAGDGGWKFTDVTAQAGVAQQTDSFTTWFFDYDNDGWPDIFVAGYSMQSAMDVGAFELGKPFQAETSRLYRNNHDGTFTDVAKQMRLDRAILVMGAGFGDLDNDGWLDVYLGTGESSYEALLPNRMFRNAGGKTFEDVTTSGGFGHLQKGHSVAFGDMGNNGHEDVFEEMGGAFPGDTYTSVLYRNPGNANHWVTLELEGVKANRAAIGARLDVTVEEHGLTRHVFRTVGFGSSFGGNPLRQHIGLGPAGTVKSIEVKWPGSRTVQRFNGLAVDRMFHLREGNAKAKEVKLKSFRIGGGAMPAMGPMAGMQDVSQ